jgi:hypothetical protein
MDTTLPTQNELKPTALHHFCSKPRPSIFSPWNAIIPQTLLEDEFLALNFRPAGNLSHMGGQVEMVRFAHCSHFDVIFIFTTPFPFSSPRLVQVRMMAEGP